MLGKTAGGLFWMFRYLERSKNIARLVDAGFRIALTQSDSENSEWTSILATTGALETYESVHKDFEGMTVIDFLLRDSDNPSSVISVMRSARNNARLSRTALTRDVWEAVNESWMMISDRLKNPITYKDLPDVLGLIRRQSAQVQGTLHGTMLRNDIFNFARLGTFVERADNTARILDVKYYILLPSVQDVGSPLDNQQWEMILRSVSAEQSYRWHHRDEITAKGIAHFMIWDPCLPQSLAFSVSELVSILGNLDSGYDKVSPSSNIASKFLQDLNSKTVDTIFESGLHEFISKFLERNNELAASIVRDFRFTA